MLSLFLLVQTVQAQVTNAQIPNYNLQLYTPPTDSLYTFLVQEVPSSLNGIFIKSVTHSTKGLLTYNHHSSYQGKDKEVNLIDSTIQEDVVIGYSKNIFRIAVQVPVYLSTKSEPELLKSGVGDVIVDTKINLIPAKNQFSMALYMNSSVPTGTTSKGLKNPSLVYSGGLSTSVKIQSDYRIHASLGHRQQDSISMDKFKWGSNFELAYGASANLADLLGVNQDIVKSAGLSLSQRILSAYSGEGMIVDSMFGVFMKAKPFESSSRVVTRLGVGGSNSGLPGASKYRVVLDIGISK